MVTERLLCTVSYPRVSYPRLSFFGGVGGPGEVRVCSIFDLYFLMIDFDGVGGSKEDT